MACNGTVYSYSQLEGLWINAGGPRAVAPIAAAIAEAESGGCTGALNLTDNNGTQTSVGLWQISNGTHSYPTSWLTAAGNAAAAVTKYNGAGHTFAPWGTYNSGAYKSFVNAGTTPNTNVPSGPSSSSSSTSGGGSADPACAWALGTINLKVTSIGGGCLIRKATLRHLAGGALMVGGGLVVLPGVLVLAAFAFRGSGAQAAAQGSLAALGPYGRTANRVVSAPGQRRQRRTQAAAKQQAVASRRQAATRRTQAAEVRQGSTQARRAAGPPVQQRRAVAGQAPRRRAIAPPPPQRAPRAEHHE